MGAGIAAARGSGSAIASKNSATDTTSITPLSSVQSVAPRHTTAASPLPPTAVHTANPRQHLTDAHTATPPTERPHHPQQPTRPPAPPQQSTATALVAATPLEKRLQVPESCRGDLPPSQRNHFIQATTTASLSAEDSRPPPSVLDTAVKRQMESGERTDAATNPNADVSNVEADVSGPAFRRMLNNDSVDESGEDGGNGERRHTAPSPSPDAPGGAVDGEDAHAAQHQQQFFSPPTTTAAANAAGSINDALFYRPITRSASPGQALRTYDGLPLTSVQQVLASKHKVYRICLTGGPCAGKSTMLSAMQARIPQRTGFRVMCVPEAATLLVTGGMQWDSNITVAQQSVLLRTQLALEDQFFALAVASAVPTIIVSDRGTMDGRAFCSDAQFQEILRNVGSTVDVLRDRYDAVLHMVTAANGAEEFYNLDNPARYEDLDGARASDLRLQEMYVGHHMFRLLDNSTTFDDKIERGLQIVGQVVHKEQCAPASPSFYLVRRCPRELPVASASYTTYTTVLNNSQMNDIRLLVKREMSDGSSMHFFKSVKDMAAAAATSSAHSTPRAVSRGSCGASFRSSMVAGGGANQFSAPSQQQRIESAQRISSREYNSLKQHRDRARAEVVMQATHFIYEGANYELTTLLAPSWAAGRQTLTVESCTPSAAQKSPSAALRLPPFLEVDREVPVESLTTAFLISHRETGALYTSLAFAPVFSRAVVTAVGAHADTENILNSTFSTPRGLSALHAETNTLPAPPADTERPQEAKDEESAAPAAPARRGLAPLCVNTAPTAASAKGKSTPKTTAEAPPPQEMAPYALGGSLNAQQPRIVVTPSSFSLSGEEDAGAEVVGAAAGEHPQPERRVFARDPESILPPIESKKVRTH
ncbi:hypothetical protein ABB37_02837 [Leptomonas pyrrhocoris]|uniref:NadR/Ttd14 AAA domain-containing protein n=1 Tax=Leptomonas pyrrhocoris TaxID=157538 RepID=A0A0M9G5X0_LEPPY|nr:hypothetical protein ABB37_02837 [Leptomonas pyrrhocoris]KPA83140.1 hypothetical protein ABB37_02837 [Leptomonas pyrrhocoris]|eukprot:XP_015661579.1 hypothetical protein ABB37_02837 [Leptomonas pyrrhocoris]